MDDLLASDLPQDSTALTPCTLHTAQSGRTKERKTQRQLQRRSGRVRLAGVRRASTYTTGIARSGGGQ